MRPEAALLQRQRHDRRMDEQLLAEAPAEHGELLDPVLGRVGTRSTSAYTSSTTAATRSALSRTWVYSALRDAQPLGQPTHRQVPAARIFEQGERLVNDR